MFTVERKAIRFSATIEDDSENILDMLSFMTRKAGIRTKRKVVTESWCVMDPSGSLVCMCMNENLANMVEIALNRDHG